MDKTSHSLGVGKVWRDLEHTENKIATSVEPSSDVVKVEISSFGIWPPKASGYDISTEFLEIF